MNKRMKHALLAMVVGVLLNSPIKMRLYALLLPFLLLHALHAHPVLQPMDSVWLETPALLSPEVFEAGNKWYILDEETNDWLCYTREGELEFRTRVVQKGWPDCNGPSDLLFQHGQAWIFQYSRMFHRLNTSGKYLGEFTIKLLRRRGRQYHFANGYLDELWQMAGKEDYVLAKIRLLPADANLGYRQQRKAIFSAEGLSLYRIRNNKLKFVCFIGDFPPGWQDTGGIFLNKGIFATSSPTEILVGYESQPEIGRWSYTGEYLGSLCASWIRENPDYNFDSFETEADSSAWYYARTTQYKQLYLPPSGDRLYRVCYPALSEDRIAAMRAGGLIEPRKLNAAKPAFLQIISKDPKARPRELLLGSGIHKILRAEGTDIWIAGPYRPEAGGLYITRYRIEDLISGVQED